MYIYDLPHFERQKLSSLLDQNNRFEELAITHMKFDSTVVQTLRQEFYRGNSPTYGLLNLWGNQNHCVLELFILLHRMKHYQAMAILKPFIETKYHHLIKEAPIVQVTDLVAKMAVTESEQKILNVQEESRENNESLLLPPPRVVKSKSPTHHLSNSSVMESAGAMLHIPYEELQKSTNNWDNGSILGRGGFGIVFKGTWKCTQVAIKRIEQKDNNPESHNEQIKQSITELHCLSTYRHDNVLPLYGYSIGGPQPCLVYQYMSGGSLESRLYVRDPARALAWPTRLSIAIGAARGLQFLHTMHKPLVHGDIKPANILLDPNDIPRIGDFGLAREGPHSNHTYIKVSRIHGTRPYLPDEFIRSKRLSTKVDTYSFGIVLFEIATALRAYSDKRPNRYLRDHVVDYEGDVLELKDQRVMGGENYFKGLIEIGKDCVGSRAKGRPEMVAVLLKLESVQ